MRARKSSPGEPALEARAGAAPAGETADARILSIAADHLRRHGARGLTVVGVAEAAGMTHANVYRYFPSKGALIDAIAARWLKGLEATLAEIADAPDPADDKLERLILAEAQAQRDLLAKDRHLFEVYAEAAASARAVVRKHRARLRHLIERVVDEGVATDLFDPRDRERALAFVSDAAYRFVNPVAVRADSDMPVDIFQARLAATIRAIQRVLTAGIL